MLQIVHWFVVGLYICTPAVAGLVALRRKKIERGGAIVHFLTTLFIGLALGTLLTVFYSHLLNAKPGPIQLLLCAYLASSALLLIKGLDSILLFVGIRARRAGWVALTLFARALILMCVGLPLFLSGTLVYRPRVEARVDPSLLHASFVSTTFSASDGVQLSGWWVPATNTTRRGTNHAPSTKTVIVCDDVSAGKARDLNLVRKLLPDGYNALLFDFRGQGHSSGQLSSLGDLERRDVLGAVHWLRINHPKECQQLVGLGASTGGAALIAAAVDPGADGQAISALAVYGVFDSVPQTLAVLSSQTFSPPLNRLIPHIALPLASATVGVNLASFAPGDMVAQLWPRPIFIIHGVADELIDFSRGRALFDAATYPKQRLWILKDHDGTLADDQAAAAVRDFFDTAQPSPAI